MSAPIAARAGNIRLIQPLTRSLERTRVRYYLALVVVDVVLILAGFGFVGQIYLDFRPFRYEFLQAQLLLPL
jgi:hypothetical protein